MRPRHLQVHVMNNYSSLNDQALAGLLQTGDRQAFTALYSRYWEKMVIVAYVKLQSTQDAEEVVQDLFVDLWNRRGNLQLRNSFHTYISGALKYKIYTFLAKKHQEQARHSSLAADDVCHNTEEWLSYEALREDLEKAVLELPEKCRLVFRLSRESGLSNNDIANTLSIAPKTVEKHLTKALLHLRTTLKSFFLLFL